MTTNKESSNNIFQRFSFFFRRGFHSQKIAESNSIIFNDHLDSTITRIEKIQKEKRNRNQAYQALDYIISCTSYFDFFSADAFQIAKNAKNFTQVNNKKIVTSDLLLLPFFYTKSKITEIFKNYGITKENIEEIVSNYHIKSPQNFTEQNIYLLQEFVEQLSIYFPFQLDKITPNPKIKYSLEINRIFEKAAENALIRFKTPVITTEILFLTLMEEENTRASKIIKKFLKTETDWFLLRYQLMKKLHKQETFIRTEITLNQHYFAYLLKTRCLDIDLENLMENNSFEEAVSSFRNELISDVLRVDIYDVLENEIYSSLEKHRKGIHRIYSVD